ncbi:hypothetical protein HD553DRAFT_346753 [Filobasidium floriforme]|uniref:uncharacterized protein n=1 Tax=Filobasidium floriforme TaxID=5210 RepID=UPI001E8E9FD9|nr:uncharacterized protein HD553DRAFT_346753 [Filobasidium floriforme]KAH8077228.1 hypothetical protein HD553DRAFT_346753 [Filobasidium floriforme]
MVRLFSLIALLGAITSSVSARFVCPGSRTTDTGKGMAAFRFVEASYMLTGGFERMFQCTDECWNRGPGGWHNSERDFGIESSDVAHLPPEDCAGVIFHGKTQSCQILKAGHGIKLNMLYPSPDTPEGGHMAVAMKAEKGSDWQGACDSKNAKTVPFSAPPIEGCCDIWYL